VYSMVLKVKNFARQRSLTDENWTDRHTKVLEATHQGVPNADIAAKNYMTRAAVVAIQNQPIFKERLKTVHMSVVERITEKQIQHLTTNNVQEARRHLDNAAVMAAKTMIAIAQTGDGTREQVTAAKDILDRCGLKPIEIVETRERVYSPEEVIHAKNVLLETEDIVKRLSTQSSPFILGDRGKGKLASSDTDKAHETKNEGVLLGSIGKG